MNKMIHYVFFLLLALSLTACGKANQEAGGSSGGKKIAGTPTAAAEGVEVSEENPLVIDKQAKTVKVYAKLNGKYLVEPTRHGLNFHEGKYGNQALFTSYANQSNFHDALLAIGAEPGNNLSGDTKGQTIEGSSLDVTVTWEGASKEYKITEVVLDSAGKPIQYKFGGNYERSVDAFTGCLACFDSCPVGITSNSSHPQGSFDGNQVEFRGNKDVLPVDGTPVVITFKLM